MRNLLFVSVLILFTGTLFAQTATPPSAGNGTSGYPFQIASLENLCWIASSADYWNNYYIQTADINASVTSSWFSGAGWTPIGNISVGFTGNYNGNGHTIDSLFINRPSTDYIGLFGYTDKMGLWGGAVIVSLGITNANITGRWKVGGLVGYNDNSSTVSNCYSTGSISGTSDVGGLVGYNEYSTVSECYSTGSISGGSSTGGLVGHNYISSTVSYCYSTGSVSGNSYVGGLVGFSEATIYNCYSTGSISGGSSTGGLVGYNFYSSTVSNCYSTGSVRGDSTSSSVGGLVGTNYATVNNSFWDTQTSGCGTSSGGTGITTGAMKTKLTFTFAGWSSSIWYMDAGINNGYPYLLWQNPGGTPLPESDDIYNTLTGPDDGYLQLRSYAFNNNGKPTNDADLSAKVWIMWANEWFYLYEEVMDDTLSANAANVYEEDEIELMFDPQPTDSVTNSIWYTRLTAPAEDVVAWDDMDNVSVGDKEWERRNIVGGYALKLAIKWSAIQSGSEKITPAVGNIFGMAINQHDNDAHARRQASVQWAAVLSDGVWNTPKYLGTVKFLADNKLQFIPTNSMTGVTNSVPYDGSDDSTGIKNASTTIPETFSLGQNYPNPFNPSTNISFTLLSKGFVSLKVFDLMGREVATIVSEEMSAGSYLRQWNAVNISSGIYFYRLQANSFTETKKLVLLR
jgi:hypothetical protein